LDNWHLNEDRDGSSIREARVIPNDASKAVYDEFKRMYEAEQVLSLRDLIQILRRRLWLILLMGLLFSGLAGGYSWAQTPAYEASVTMLLTAEPKSNAPIDLQAQAYGLQAIMPTITEMTTTLPVAQDVVRRLNLSKSPADLLAGLSVESGSESQFFYVSYTDSKPERARLIANSVGEVLSEYIISDVNPSNYAVEAKVWERAELPTSPVSPDPMRNILLMLVFGLMLGTGLAFLLEYLDDSWKSPYEAEEVLGVPTFGAIPSLKGRIKNRRTL
jgi:capsular polysaccharide biosynthesis protein